VLIPYGMAHRVFTFRSIPHEFSISSYIAVDLIKVNVFEGQWAVT
jgi:hypothetical protein